MPHDLPAATVVTERCTAEQIDARQGTHHGYTSVPAGRHVTILFSAADQDGHDGGIVVQDPARSPPRALIIPRECLRL